MNQLVKEMEGIKKEEKISYSKKTGIKAKLANVAKKVLKALPKGAETLAAFTPLAPFSKLIGEGVEKLVKSIQKEV